MNLPEISSQVAVKRRKKVDKNLQRLAGNIPKIPHMAPAKKYKKVEWQNGASGTRKVREITRAIRRACAPKITQNGSVKSSTKVNTQKTLKTPKSAAVPGCYLLDAVVSEPFSKSQTHPELRNFPNGL